jgi:hypothetical protein
MLPHISMYRQGFLSGNASDLYFGGDFCGISTETPTMLTENLRGFPQYLQKDGTILPQLRPRLLLCTPFPIFHSPPVIRRDIILVTNSVVK